MSRKDLGGIEGALRVLQRLPACIVREAAAGNEDLENFLWFPTNIVAFAERLVSIAGLAAMAIYSDRLLAPAKADERDQLIENYLSTILFGRGYGNGLACSIIQRCAVITSGPLAPVITESRPVTGLVTSRPEDPGNLVRSQLHDPPEDQLATLVRSLYFLQGFSFAVEDNTPCVRYRGKEMEIRPFLFWDGLDLWRFGRILREDEEKDHILCLSATSGDDRRESVRIDSRARKLILDISRLFGADQKDGELSDETMTQSVMPLFAESYPNMNRLAQKIYEKTNLSTRFKLWVGPLIGDDYEKASEWLTNEVFVTNAIIKQCMDRDPISVMESYFIEEPGDPSEYFAFLVHDSSERRKLEREIKAGVDEYANNLFPFYCESEHREELGRLIARYRARLMAQKIVRLFGFPIFENVAQDSLEDHVRRARIFLSYLDSAAAESDHQAKVREGLMACSRAAETILRTLLLFYNALRWYRPEHPDSLDDAGVRRLGEFGRKIKKSMLGTTIDMVQNLNKDSELRERVQALLGREYLWPEKNRQRAFAALSSLRLWRNEHAHVRGAPIDKARKLVEGFIDFLDWLADPLRQPGQSWRIFPALLSLNVVTRNSCGISSIKYSLVSTNSSQRPITLYTPQPLSVNSGSFFGLPHLNKTVKDLWVNPVLIPSQLLRSSSFNEDAHE